MLRLPRARGKIAPNEPLAPRTWFRVGGPAEALFKPADAEDLAYFLENCPKDIPVTIIGLASNLLVRDGGVPGVVVKLGPQFSQVKIEGATITVGAGAVDLNVARAAQNAGITGLEFLCGIPGTIGGGLRMNAGAYGREFKDIVDERRHSRPQRQTSYAQPSAAGIFLPSFRCRQGCDFRRGSFAG